MSGRGATSVTRLPPPPQEISRPLRSAGGIFFLFFKNKPQVQAGGCLSDRPPMPIRGRHRGPRRRDAARLRRDPEQRRAGLGRSVQAP